VVALALCMEIRTAVAGWIQYMEWIPELVPMPMPGSSRMDTSTRVLSSHGLRIRPNMVRHPTASRPSGVTGKPLPRVMPIPRCRCMSTRMNATRKGGSSYTELSFPFHRTT